jgi:hypothetical protein
VSGIFESIERPPVEYLPTGDRALLMAWYTGPRGLPYAVLCLEDGTAVGTSITGFKFDYRYATREQRWYDVSRIEEEDPDADSDQGDADDGGSPVPGLVPEPD